MSRTTIWFGPVNLAQVKGSVLPSSTALNLQCKGDGAPSCAQTADAWLASGRRLPKAMAALQQPPPAPGDELALGAFSAGGSVVKRLLLAPEDLAPVKVVTLADATYTDWQGPGIPVPPEGFVLYGLDVLAAGGSKLFIATASSNAPISKGVALPSGSKTLESIRLAIEARSGQRFSPTTIPGVSPAPVAAWRLGNILFADYQATVPHASHATVLAPQLWQQVVLPWRATRPPEHGSSGGGGAGPATTPTTPVDPVSPPTPGPSLLAALGVFLASVAIGIYATRAARRRQF